MQKIAFVADPHIGNFVKLGGKQVCGMNERCRMALHTLSEALRSAVDMGVDYFVIVGDLFDKMPTPQIINEVQRMLYSHKDNLQFFILAGNHDVVSSELWDDYIAPLGYMEHCGVYRGTAEVALRTGLSEAAYLYTYPFRFGSYDEHIADDLRNLTHVGPNIYKDTFEYVAVLAIHGGIRFPDTPAILANDQASVDTKLLKDMCLQFGIDYVFGGHWHTRREHHLGDTKVYQLGALCPRGWSDPGLFGYGDCMVLDTELRDVSLHVVPGPRFVSIDYADREDVDVLEGSDNTLFLKVHCERKDYWGATSLVEQLKERKVIEKGIVSVRSGSMVTEKDRADVVASTRDLKLLKKYIEGRDWGSVSREAVFTRVQRYMEGSRDE